MVNDSEIQPIPYVLYEHSTSTGYLVVGSGVRVFTSSFMAFSNKTLTSFSFWHMLFSYSKQPFVVRFADVEGLVLLFSFSPFPHHSTTLDFSVKALCEKF